MHGVEPTTEASSGTVTFLFTDIEGSTRRWQADRAAMQAALAAHDEVLRRNVERHRGQVVKHTGDGIMAVFASANDAVAAAVGAQAELELPVRMGLHTGEAELRDGDYFGPTLNRAARIMGAGHGGQILSSSATASLVDDVDLVDLGSHRLKDLLRLERIWQVGDGQHPPLRVLDRTPGNVSTDDVELFGRDDLVASVAAHLSESRVVSLVGVGGVGKTSAALAVARSVQGDYPDGVWFVALAPLGEPESVAPAIAGVFSHVSSAGVEPRDSLVGLLASKELLLVLDNCEHLLDEVADLVEELTDASPGLRVLVTSREGLGVARERHVSVPSLAANDAGAASVGLFVARASQLDGAFVLDESNTDDVIAICKALDGIPLAIELAATRVRTLAPREIRERLSDRFRLLTGGRRRVVERHQTLRHAVQWSYELLGPVERKLLDRLSVFANGCTLPAIEAVCAGDPVDAADVVDLVDALVAKSLVVAERRSGAATRYRLLETIRQFAEEQLHSADESVEMRRQFNVYMVATLGELVDSPGDVGDTPLWRWIDDEFDNLRAAFESLLVEDVDGAARLATLMTAAMSWATMRYEQLGWPTRVIRLLGDPREPPADLLGASVVESAFAGDTAAARSTADRSLAIARRRPPPTPHTEPWLAVVTEAIMAGDGDRTLAIVAEIRELEQPTSLLVAISHFYESWAHLFRGDADASRAAALRNEPDMRGGFLEYFTEWSLARVETDPTEARARYRRAAAQPTRQGTPFIGLALAREVARVELLDRRPRSALELLTPLCEQWYSAGDTTNWASVLCLLAPAFAGLDDWMTASMLLGAVTESRTYAIPMAGMDTADLDELTALSKAELGDATFDREHQTGRTASAKEVMDRLRAAIERQLAAPPPIH
jgi:predicted ATPase/class 3 adenylate cyclase